MKYLKYISLVLVIIGALNWGLVGLVNFDLVAFLFGDMTLLSKLVYILVGLAALVLIFMEIFMPCECMED
ncbi:MAG: DUF378 domain-containing protein [Candidatus Gastranaerophilales bacterium]|nr:DUF378 domain-containing protein [Candidatus Gastranaerophilales bacterium]